MVDVLVDPAVLLDPAVVLDPVLVLDPAVEDPLWVQLRHARSAGHSPVLPAAEDAVFRFYRPLAAAFVGRSGFGDLPVSAAVLEAAENTLAAAVLLWPYQRAEGFRRYAERAIGASVRRVGQRPRRRGRRPGPTDRTAPGREPLPA